MAPPAAGAADPGTAPPVMVRGLRFRYAAAGRDALVDVHLTVGRGERCLLIGRNGAGKTTLLRVLAGRHLVPGDVVRVLGRPAFHDPSLASRVVFLGGRFPFDVDVTVAEILDRAAGVDDARRERLVKLLGVERDWHMDRVSDGQRRRVQLLLGLLRPAEVLLLDEVMTDLDLVARADLLAFLREESAGRGAAILYATHILEEVEEWATGVALMEEGRLLEHRAMGEVAGPLTQFALGFLRRSS
ncbi:MAG: ATP-binding cassette domain-containing protein [Deltaproteobacteria bacterium]|nr:ATP-binding cassette domain-containing protein [Deltaproteobacteria bacterium]